MNAVKFAELTLHFGTQVEMARALGVSRSAVSHWVRRGSIPAERAIAIEILTAGEFKAVDLI
jgi:DNA-binding transcriptional regulator YdaS (Cro superfamily)